MIGTSRHWARGVALWNGARRTASTTEIASVETMAFRNPDGTSVLVAVNTGTEARVRHRRTGAHQFRSALASGAVVTFRWR